jgi:hypothetical protein
MTFGNLKYTVKGLLIGDNTIPTKESGVLIALLDMAFHYVGSRAKSLHLLTLNKDENIMRLDQGDYLARTPKLPLHNSTLDDIDNVILDIDHELCFPVARLIASYVCKDKRVAQLHVAEADRMISEYNAKVEEIMTKMAKTDI